LKTYNCSEAFGTSTNGAEALGASLDLLTDAVNQGILKVKFPILLEVLILKLIPWKFGTGLMN
jgi:hypothetical protein